MSSELVRIRGYINDADSFVLPVIDGVINNVWDKYQLGMPTRDELDDFALELLGNDDHFVQHDAAVLLFTLSKIQEGCIGQKITTSPTCMIYQYM